MQRFTTLLVEAARPVRHLAGDRWFVDETYVRVSGLWSYVYRAIDKHGQVIVVYVSDDGPAVRVYGCSISGQPFDGTTFETLREGTADLELLLDAATFEGRTPTHVPQAD